MSGREWKPGDVGMSKYGRVFFADGWWLYDDGSGREGITVGEPTGLRPLLVIDPEDREQTDALVDALMSMSHVNGFPNRMQAALRSLVTPPKPEEPTGLGAVLLDADGTRWVKWSTEARAGRVWKHENEGGNYQTYADIAAVKVLSEGIS